MFKTTNNKVIGVDGKANETVIKLFKNNNYKN